jgi:hypothetical protein
MRSEIHQNDVGTRFLITIKEDDVAVDISSATVINVYFKRPDGSLLPRLGSFYTDGTDGKIVYDVDPGDLNEAGYYKLQARVSIVTGTFYTSIYTFQAHCNLEV